MDMNQIAVEIAYTKGFDEGKQAAAEEIFTDLEEFHCVGDYKEVYCLLEDSVAKLKKKYGVK